MRINRETSRPAKLMRRSAFSHTAQRPWVSQRGQEEEVKSPESGALLWFTPPCPPPPTWDFLPSSLYTRRVNTAEVGSDGLGNNQRALRLPVFRFVVTPSWTRSHLWGCAEGSVWGKVCVWKSLPGRRKMATQCVKVGQLMKVDDTNVCCRYITHIANQRKTTNGLKKITQIKVAFKKKKILFSCM